MATKAKPFNTRVDHDVTTKNPHGPGLVASVGGVAIEGVRALSVDYQIGRPATVKLEAFIDGSPKGKCSRCGAEPEKTSPIGFLCSSCRSDWRVLNDIFTETRKRVAR